MAVELPSFFNFNNLFSNRATSNSHPNKSPIKQVPNLGPNSVNPKENPTSRNIIQQNVKEGHPDGDCLKSSEYDKWLKRLVGHNPNKSSINQVSGFRANSVNSKGNPTSRNIIQQNDVKEGHPNQEPYTSTGYDRWLDDLTGPNKDMVVDVKNDPRTNQTEAESTQNSIVKFKEIINTDSNSQLPTDQSEDVLTRDEMNMAAPQPRDSVHFKGSSVPKSNPFVLKCMYKGDEFSSQKSYNDEFFDHEFLSQKSQEDEFSPQKFQSGSQEV